MCHFEQVHFGHKKVVVLGYSIFKVQYCIQKKPGEPCLASETPRVPGQLVVDRRCMVVVYPGSGVRGDGADTGATPWYGSGYTIPLVLPWFLGKSLF